MPTDFLPDDVYLIPERLSVNLTCPLWEGGDQRRKVVGVLSYT